MSVYIYWLAVCAVVAWVSHLVTRAREAKRFDAERIAMLQEIKDALHARNEIAFERTTFHALALRAVALLRDDAHRSRQTLDGSRRYDAWREQRDALIREVER